MAQNKNNEKNNAADKLEVDVDAVIDSLVSPDELAYLITLGECN